MTQHILNAGSLAYLDSFSGLIPCKVLAVEPVFNSEPDIRVKLTASRGAYRRGEMLVWRASRVVPRGAVHYRCGIARIWAYNVQQPDRV